MAIDIKELVIKTTIDSEEKTGVESPAGNVTIDLEKLKEEIITECRELFFEMLTEEKER